MSKVIDLVGKKFGRLTVIKRMENNKRNKATWLCTCECTSNKQIIVESSSLNNGHTQSCGCYNKQRSRETNKKYNTYDLAGEYGIGYTSNGKEFYFDLEDYSKIKNYCWNIDEIGYVRVTVDNIIILQHRLIMNVIEVECEIDHINHVIVDNRKMNLRICTTSQNQCNMLIPKHNTSGVKGVCWSKSMEMWASYIYKNNKRIHLGYFNNLDDAAKERKEAEVIYHGEFVCKLN